MKKNFSEGFFLSGKFLKTKKLILLKLLIERGEVIDNCNKAIIG